MNVNGEEPMFERVLTMVAYVNSKIFCCPTIFRYRCVLIRPIDQLFLKILDAVLIHVCWANGNQ